MQMNYHYLMFFQVMYELSHDVLSTSFILSCVYDYKIVIPMMITLLFFNAHVSINAAACSLKELCWLRWYSN